MFFFLVAAIVLAISTLQIGGSHSVSADGGGKAKVEGLTLVYRDFGFGAEMDITLERDPKKAHLTTGDDDNDGPITVIDGSTFNVRADNGKKSIGSSVHLGLDNGVEQVLVRIHTSCSKPINVGFFYGSDKSDGANDPGDFGSGGFAAGLEITELFPPDACGLKPPPEEIPPTPTPVPTPIITPEIGEPAFATPIPEPQMPAALPDSGGEPLSGGSDVIGNTLLWIVGVPILTLIIGSLLTWYRRRRL